MWALKAMFALCILSVATSVTLLIFFADSFESIVAPLGTGIISLVLGVITGIRLRQGSKEVH